MIDTTTALEARANLVWVAEHWGQLRALLHRIAGDPNAPKIKGGDPHSAAPVNIEVSNLMQVVTSNAVFLGRMLIDETGWVQSREVVLSVATPQGSEAVVVPGGSMPGLLADVARALVDEAGRWHGGSDQKIAFDVCQDAYDMRRDVEHFVLDKNRAKYVGPCPRQGCDGELYMRNVEGGQCPECMTPWNLPGQYAYLRAEAEDVIMERDVLRAALVSMGYDVPHKTVNTWLYRGKVEEVEPGLYRFGDALDLAKKRGERKVSVR